MLFISFGILYPSCFVIATVVTHTICKIIRYQSMACETKSTKNRHPQDVHEIYVLQTFVLIQLSLQFNAILADYCALPFYLPQLWMCNQHLWQAEVSQLLHACQEQPLPEESGGKFLFSLPECRWKQSAAIWHKQWSGQLQKMLKFCSQHSQLLWAHTNTEVRSWQANSDHTSEDRAKIVRDASDNSPATVTSHLAAPKNTTRLKQWL